MKTKIISIINQKGGVGKTTTTANLGYALSKLGRDVLLVDFDSQASLTNYLNFGFGEQDDYYSVYELLIRELRTISPAEDEFLATATDAEVFSKTIIRPTFIKSLVKTVDGIKKAVEEDVEFGFSLLPAKLELSDYELELANIGGSHGAHLMNLLRKVTEWHEYDYILIDCNPSLGILAMNGIIAAKDGILIPTNLDVMSTRGINALLNRIVETQELLAQHDKVHMGVIGILLNLYADRRMVDRTIQNDLDRFYPFRIFNATIPESVNAKKAAMTGVIYSQIYKKAEDSFDALAAEFEERLAEMEKAGPMIVRIGEKMPMSQLADDEMED